MKRIFFLMLSFWFSCSLFSQVNTFHRIYDNGNRDYTALAMEPHSAGYYTMNAVTRNDSIVAINVASLDRKGDEVWNKDITYGDSELSSIGNLVVLEEDTLSFTIRIDSDIENRNIITKLDPQGDIFWSKATGGFNDVVSNFFDQNIGRNYDNTTINISNYQTDNNFYLHAMNIAKNGEIKWSHRSSFTDTSLFTALSLAVDSDLKVDSSFSVLTKVLQVTANPKLTFSNIGLIKLDSLGFLNFSSSYRIDSLRLDPLGIKTFRDSSDVITGYYNLSDNTNAEHGFIVKLDSLGEVIWGKRISLGNDFIRTSINSVSELENGDIVVGGTVEDELNSNNYSILIRLDQTGKIIWQRSYTREQTIRYFGEVHGIEESGSIYYTNAVDTATINDTLRITNVKLQLISVDEMGASMCEDTISQNIISDLFFEKDTLIATTVNDTILVDIESESETFSGYDIPTLTLLDTMFCPNDPIFVIEDAETEGAVGYVWNTEEITPSIIVEEESNPSVIVTMDHDLGCYILCDTAIVAYHDTVMTGIQLNTDAFCEDRTVRLTASISPGLAPYSVLWSTMQEDLSIVVPPTGMYSVSVTDACDILATAEITIDESSLPQPDPISISFDPQLYCNTDQLQLTAAGNSVQYTEFEWTDAAGNVLVGNTAVIIVPDFGTYNVSALDDCNFEVSATITISEADLPDPEDVLLLFDADRYCSTGDIVLFTEGGDLSNIEFLDANGTVIGQGSTSQMVPDFGTYAFTALDACNLEVGAQITISEDNLPTATISIELRDSLLCDLGIITLESTVNSDIFNPSYISNFMWSTGATTSAIDITEFGLYTITAEYCNVPIAAEIDATPDLNNIVSWPNVFAPQGGQDVEEDNQSFRPFVECPEAVTDYELRVYSRWGQEIFQTNDVTEAWTGVEDGNSAPADAYVYYSTYTISGVSTQVNGTVTLLR